MREMERADESGGGRKGKEEMVERDERRKVEEGQEIRRHWRRKCKRGGNT